MSLKRESISSMLIGGNDVLLMRVVVYWGGALGLVAMLFGWAWYLGL
jgi:hypothetical protein